MRSFADYVDYVNLAIFTLVAVVALFQLRAGRGRAGLWAALTFGGLALVVDLGRALPDEPSNDFEFIASRLLVAVLVLFPYLLYRFTTAFEPPTRRLERFLGLMTLVLLVWTFVLPKFPDEGEPRPAWFLSYLIGFLVHWSILTVVVTIRLWRAGRREPGVARRRMQMFSFASASITAALFLAAFAGGGDSRVDLVVALLSTASALAFLLGLAPPGMLRMMWRRPEQARMQNAITGLMSATTQDEIATAVLPPMARMIGARAVALRDSDGRVIGAHAASDEVLAAVTRGDEPGVEGSEVLRLDVPSGSMVVWTSPYAPYFGGEEARLLRTLGVLTGLALDRSRLFAQERDARLALERADHVKTNFVALAAHELRTPVATIDGIIQTLYRHGAQLSPEKQKLLEDTLRDQSTHMRTLVDQLLDLSRLDAEAVAIKPKRFGVRDRVERLVASAGADQTGDVRVDVAESLEVDADPTAFDRIVSNLIVNAFRYGRPPVTVSAEQRDRHFRLVVEDRGPGVPSEFVPDLFERFTRSGASGDRTSGTGLGLAIARSYAHAHHGDLLYENAEPHGARFQVVLPRELPNGVPTATPQATL
jgi:signal transduction histidine kinase